MSLMCLQHFRTIQKMVNDNQDDWDQFIDSTLFSIRVKIQMTTKFSPFYLMFHREVKPPLSNKLYHVTFLFISLHSAFHIN
jgi:hypothetical protein